MCQYDKIFILISFKLTKLRQLTGQSQLLENKLNIQHISNSFSYDMPATLGKKEKFVKLKLMGLAHFLQRTHHAQSPSFAFTDGSCCQTAFVVFLGDLKTPKGLFLN